MTTTKEMDVALANLCDLVLCLESCEYAGMPHHIVNVRQKVVEASRQLAALLKPTPEPDWIIELDPELQV